jgi:hypothetical protein
MESERLRAGDRIFSDSAGEELGTVSALHKADFVAAGCCFRCAIEAAVRRNHGAVGFDIVHRLTGDCPDY